MIFVLTRRSHETRPKGAARHSGQIDVRAIDPILVSSYCFPSGSRACGFESIILESESATPGTVLGLRAVLGVQNDPDRPPTASERLIWCSGISDRRKKGQTEEARSCEGRHVRSNVGVDRHATALRREAYAHLHALRRNAVACPRRTTC
jgi:hypothetical protein